MSNTPVVPPAGPRPGPKQNFWTVKAIVLTCLGLSLVLVAAAGVAAMQYFNHESAAEKEKEARNAALYKDYTEGKLPASAYETTTTRTDANGNVSTVTEPAGGGDGSGGGGWDGSQSGSAPVDSVAGMQRVSLGDPGVGIQDAMSLNIPAGWHFRGEIVRNVPCSPGDPFPEMEVSSPDGAYSVTTMTPFFTTSGRTDFDLSSCGAMAQPMPAANILTQYVVPALRRGAQVSQAEPLPDGERFVRANSGSGNGMTSSGDTARVRVSTMKDGQNVEEYIVGLTSTLRAQGMPGGTTSTIVEIFRAPAGKLDAFYQQVRSTMEVEVNPQWRERTAEMAQRQTEQAQAQGQQQRAAIMQNGQDAGAAGRAMLANTRNQIQQTGRISMNNAAASEAARHTGAVGTADYVGGRGTSTYFFCNSSGGYTTNNNPNPPGPGWYACH